MTQHEEFEAGQELDRAVRSAVTGLAQLMERLARRQQEQNRERAGRAREEWLARRDAARQQYLPWTAEGRLEKLDGYKASQKWAAAAAWSSMDPTARFAAADMAKRIRETYGEPPSVLLHRTDPKRLAEDPNPPPRLLSMNEAYGLAATHAPSWYQLPDGVRPLETDRPPQTPAETRFHEDWQYYSEAGVLPERSQHEHWAAHVGREDEFTPEKWQTPDGDVDEVARDAALAAVWAEGHEARTARDIADHEAAMHDAGMGPLADQVGDPNEAAPDHSWHAFLTPARFDAADPDDLAKAWREASAAALTGDAGAQRSADKIATMMRERRGLDPDSMLIAALTEQAAMNTEARRTAEDQLRKSNEERAAAAAPPVSAPTAGAGEAATVPEEAVSRARVIELNDLAAEFYAENLRPGTPGHRYLTDRLGPEVETGPWALGYAQPGWQNLTNHLRANGVTDEEMVAAGLAEPGKYGVRDVFRDRAMMGIRDHDSGEIVGFLGRDLSGNPRAPKIRNTGETPAFRKGDHVFGLHEADPGARLVRVEGPFDAMAVSLASDGKAAGVSPMGTQMTETQADAIAQRANGRVWLANDNDAGGTKATEEDFYRLSEKGLDVRQVDVPGSDPAAAWQERPVIMRSVLTELPDASSAAETVVDRYLTAAEASPSGFEDLMRRIEPYVSDPIEHELLTRRGVELDGHGQRGNAPEDERAPQASRSVPPRPGGEPAREAVPEGDAATSARGEQEPAYDRREEPTSDLNPPQAAARNGSSHGFSQSTEKQVQNTAPRRKGTPAKVTRGNQVTQTQGRRLTR